MSGSGIRQIGSESIDYSRGEKERKREREKVKAACTLFVLALVLSTRTT